MKQTEKNYSLSELNSDDIKNVFGQFDCHIKKIEKTLNVGIVDRDGCLKISGEEDDIDNAIKIIDDMVKLSERGNIIDEQKIDYAISLYEEQDDGSILDVDEQVICHTVSGRSVKPKTIGQMKYVEAIKKNMIVFGIGPAGTGKTYLAMAMAITAFKAGEVERIILTRPAIEAGEKLGFLPGDLQSKVDPYLRPLYDALYQIMGAESFLRNMEKGLIEVAPLAYMRGRTLDNAYIILDEAQNTTQAQMKMFLTRIGFGSKVIVTGDSTQKDLPKDVPSGLDVAQKVLSKVEGIAFINLTSKDVVRHPLVQKIVKAYENYESSHVNKHRQEYSQNGRKRKKQD
ncbi:MAG: PhoH family protein [Lachnospiraceae bacterium]|nr:PhoH family protein [Lachnospiraceae bacterium]